MRHPTRSEASARSRGQSLVEFALVLPIILFLTLAALDFGRVYLGYINLQNMARIAANFAANNPTAWGVVPDTAVQTKYKNLILSDAAATNCALPKVSGVTTVPTPTFIDQDGNGRATDLGDTAEVQIRCSFGIITPGMASVVGGNVAVSAAARFPVKSGLTASGSGGGGGVAPNAAFSGNGAITPSSISGVVPFVVDFRDTSGGSPTSWLWTFPDDGTTSNAQDPMLHTFTSPGTFVVTMQATNANGSSTASMGVTVLASSVVDFTASQTAGTAPLTVTFTDASTPGGTSYDWTFGAGQGTGSGTSVNKTYTTPGTYTVSLTVTYPSPVGPLTATKVGYITVGVGNCTVPSLNGVRRNDALGVWQGSPYNFTGIVVDGPGAPSGNYIITAQDRTAGSLVPCNSNVTVNRP